MCFLFICLMLHAKCTPIIKPRLNRIWQSLIPLSNLFCRRRLYKLCFVTSLLGEINARFSKPDNSSSLVNFSNCAPHLLHLRICQCIMKWWRCAIPFFLYFRQCSAIKSYITSFIYNLYLFLSLLFFQFNLI